MLWLWSVCEGHGGWRLVAGRDKRPLRLLPRQLCHGDTADGESWSELIACAQPGTAPLLGLTFTTSELSVCVLPQNEIKISSTFYFEIVVWLQLTWAAATELSVSAWVYCSALEWLTKFSPVERGCKVSFAAKEDVLAVLTMLTWAFSVTPSLVWRRESTACPNNRQEANRLVNSMHWYFM